MDDGPGTSPLYEGGRPEPGVSDDCYKGVDTPSALIRINLQIVPLASSTIQRTIWVVKLFNDGSSASLSI